MGTASGCQYSERSEWYRQEPVSYTHLDVYKRQMQAIVNAAVKKAYGNEHEIEWMEVLAGERAFNETGSWLSLIHI